MSINFADFDVIFNLFQKTYHDTFNARDLIKKLLINNQNDLMDAVLQVQNEIEEKTKISERDNHPEWFENVDSKKSTKEEIMRIKAKDRIKGYFYKTKDELTKARIYQTDSEGRRIIDELLTDFFVLLSGVDFFECLFDRTHKEKFHLEKKRMSDEIDARTFVKRRKVDEDTKLKIKKSNLLSKYLVALCNDLGLFNCHGKYDSDSCSYNHKINPYASRESFILFQIFNLDHQVEISRSIFPSIIKNVEKLCTEKSLKCEQHNKSFISLSTITYFLEIFTVKNLKLVHIICHDKGSHDLDTKGRLLCEDCHEMKMIKKIKMKIS